MNNKSDITPKKNLKKQDNQDDSSFDYDQIRVKIIDSDNDYNPDLYTGFDDKESWDN